VKNVVFSLIPFSHRMFGFAKVLIDPPATQGGVLSTADPREFNARC
jgi:hypothetical protein